MHIMAIGGSPRLNGNTNYLIDQALQEAAGLGATTDKIILSQHKMSPCLVHANCSELDSCAQKDDGVWILDKLCEADAVILATPVYYYDVSSWMKTFIDRNWFLRQHKRKCLARAVGIIVVGAGKSIDDTVESLKRYINSSSFNSIPADRVFIATAYANAPGEVKNNQDVLNETRSMGRKLVESLRK